MVKKTLALMGLSYLVGSIPFSYLVARARGVDLRTVGSGNIGAANVWRSCGREAFLVAVTLDMLKGLLLPLLALRRWQMPPLAVSLVGACAMLGHTFSVFLGFKGGKAVATGGGVLLAISPLAMLSGVVAWAIAFAASRISAVGSLVAAAVTTAVALAQMVQGRLHAVYGVFTCLAAAGILLRHRSNIQRLLQGKENRFQRL